MISVSMWQYRIGIKRIKNFENVLEKPVLNWYYFGIEVALKGEKPFKITVKIDNFNARIAHKTRKNTRKLLFLTLFYRERRTPKRNAVGSTPITDAKTSVFCGCFSFPCGSNIAYGNVPMARNGTPFCTRLTSYQSLKYDSNHGRQTSVSCGCFSFFNPIYSFYSFVNPKNVPS